MGRVPLGIMKRVLAFKKEASRLCPIERLIIFGSYVKGENRRDSDVDLIVVSRAFRGVSFVRRSPRLRLLWKKGVPVDLICLTPEEFKARLHGPTLVSMAVEEGVEA